jgi:hypothetical protein
MLMVENTDAYTKDYIKEGWASLGFDFKDSFDSSVETNADYGNGSYTYDTNGTYFSKGGYL